MQVLARELASARNALAQMESRKDAAYLERNQVVAALAKAFPSGVARTAIEGWSEDWHGCVYIDLPTGQASWHFHDSQAYLFDGLPPYAGKWDGHDTPEKYRRLAALAAPAAPAWQPIETAPKQYGSLLHIIAATPLDAGGYYVEEAYWDPERREWWPANTDYGDATGAAIYPTLWQPMPAAPAA